VLKKNFKLYLFTFGFAFILWLYLKFNVVYNVELSIPLNVQVSNTQALSENLPENITIVASGKGWDLLNMMLARDKDFSLDVSNVKNDTKLSTRQMLSERLNIPSNVSVLSVEPETITISFEKVFKKYVKVTNNVSLQLSDGYEIIGDPEILPDSVLVSGASSIVSNLRSLPTEYKLIKDVNENVTLTVSLKDTLSNIIRIEPSMVTVIFKVDLLAEKDFKDLQIQVENIPEDKEVLLVPPSLSLSLRSGVNELASINPADIRIIVQYSDIERDSLGYVVPEVILPFEASIINMTPEKLQYIIKRK
jgi:YbbR domain-containing protein